LFVFRLLLNSVKVKNVYKTTVLPAVLYGCETWSLILTEEHRLRVFENGVLRGIFGTKGGEVIGNWRKYLIEKLHNSYSTKYRQGDQIKEDGMDGACRALG
jgi:hypothetical protein